MIEMRVRAKLTIRNECILRARERLGLTQAQLAYLADVPMHWVVRFESVRFGRSYVSNVARDLAFARIMKYALRIADALELDIEQVAPAELFEKDMETTFVRIVDVDPDRLIPASTSFLQALPGPSEEVSAIELREKITRALRTLTYKEEQVLKLRFGLEGERPKTLSEVAKTVRVTKERVRQLEVLALRKLRNPHRSSGLRSFLDE